MIPVAENFREKPEKKISFVSAKTGHHPVKPARVIATVAKPNPFGPGKSRGVFFSELNGRPFDARY